MNYNINLIPHKDIGSHNLKKIVGLKMQHWKYSFEEQIKWIENNLKENDYHLLLTDNDTSNLIAYMNLVSLVVNYNSSSHQYFGIGNVCVDKNVNIKGLGLLIMQISTFILKQHNIPGILLCKKELIPFYLKTGWMLYSGNCFINKEMFNYSVFTSIHLPVNEIYIEKSF